MSYAEFRADALAKIEKFGRIVIAVPNGNNSFSYTVGNCQRGLPELLIVGPFEPTGIRSVLNVMTDKMIERGSAFEENTLIDIGAPLHCTAFHASDLAKLERTIQVGQLLKRPYDLMQVVSPDPAGLFPWQPGCNPAFQVPLYRATPMN
jgi:hypothetical protein